MHSAQSCALFLGDLGTCSQEVLKIRYFEIESGGTFCKQNCYINIYLP